jgi:hypothetical protein
MRTRLPLIVAIGAVLLLTACAPSTSTTHTAGATPSASRTAAPPPPPPASGTPSPSAGTASAYPTGTCTQAALPSDAPTPVIYSIYQFGADSPVTFHYQVFNLDGTNPVLTGTTTAYVTTITVWPCTVSSESANDTLTATVPHTEASLGCVQAYGGQLVQTDQQGGDGPQPFSVNCSGNPGA